VSRTGLAALLALLALSSGCVGAPTLYHWGHYEALIYATYAAPGSVPPERQIELLERDYQQARAANRPVPPGFHAYLGYLYYSIGRADQARPGVRDREGQLPGVRGSDGPPPGPPARKMKR
jgi:hypothetical protein